MKKLFLILVLCLVWNNVIAEEDNKVCLFDGSKLFDCDKYEVIQRTINKSYEKNIFFQYFHPGISVEEFRKLLIERRDKLFSKEEQKRLEETKQLKLEKEAKDKKRNEDELRCAVISGEAKNYFAAKKIYSACLKEAGY